MRKLKKILIYILIFYIFEFALVFPFPSKEAINNNPAPPTGETININKSDRILIISPHPDDAALSSSGIIREVVLKDAKVKVVYITCGSHNTTTMVKDSLIHTVTPLSGILLGETRHREAICAMKSLGLKEKDLIFLGFPDFGTLKIWTDHFNNKPYFSGVTIHDKTFYSFVYKKGVPFTGSNELKLLEGIIKDFKPTKIIYTPTIDLNSDHRATGLFTEAALFDLRNEINPETFQYFMHAEGWPIPEKYDPNLYISTPNYIRNLSGEWFNFFLTKKEEDNKEIAIKCHKSQVESKPDFMLSFVRKNELFFREEEKVNSYMPLWTDKEMEKLMISPFVSSVYIGESKNNIYYKIKVKRGFEKFTKLYILIYPEETGKSFLISPKYRISITRTVKNNLNVSLENNGKLVLYKKEELNANSKNLLLDVQINKKYLKGTMSFFTAVQLEQADLRVSESPWWNVFCKN